MIDDFRAFSCPASDNDHALAIAICFGECYSRYSYCHSSKSPHRCFATCLHTMKMTIIHGVCVLALFFWGGV